MALLIANEWENQSDVLKQHSLPVVSLSDPSAAQYTDMEDLACVESD